MQYPLISEYIRSILHAEDNLDKLSYLRPVFDDHNEPYRSNGAFAVVFKMRDVNTGKCYALKCFTEDQPGRAEAYRRISEELEGMDKRYLIGVRYLENELFVDSACTDDTEFPVLLMDWVDGETMENYIATNHNNKASMARLCGRFCDMASWLRSQPIAHGDMKPDNVIVKANGGLVMVDYDGMFVPSMKGEKSPTVGTRDYSHPERTPDDFDETIDDFTLVNIALSLKAVSIDPSLYERFGGSERLLFSQNDYVGLNSEVMKSLTRMFYDKDLTKLLSLFLMALSKKSLSDVSFVETKERTNDALFLQSLDEDKKTKKLGESIKFETKEKQQELFSIKEEEKEKRNSKEQIYILSLFLFFMLLGCVLYGLRTKHSEVIEEKQVKVETEIEPTIIVDVNKRALNPSNFPSDQEKVEPEPFITVEEMPSYPGGDAALLQYVMNEIVYPEAARENNIQGRVFIRFCVTATGDIGQVQVLRGVDPEIDAEAVRAIKTIKGFKPGKKGGVAVPVWYQIPINFKLTD